MVTWVVPLALGGFAILLMVTFSMVSARRRHHAAMTPAQMVGPRILVHDINDDRCTGCDACVAVCPTNVLDLVANKSRVLRFEDCIQCEACMFACPTEALVMFPEGSEPPPVRVPDVDENYQTKVPGQYLIGEVAGKPLVKNAANLGRAVVEHMMSTGLYPGALGGGEGVVDVAIVGSGPGGLSAALSCIQKGLSYVVLEKEQMIASTIARYPKGKLVMAEPYEAQNVSLLPVFDSSKEQLIPIWRELIERVRLQVRQGESVESVQRVRNGSFEIRTTVAAYRAQRVVLSIGTRGKPRTLQVPGENLPKVYSLLEDPDDWAGKNVLVVGGGDSACEAALALADAGARVIISYRGRAFSRAQPKNKSSIERYAAEGRIKAKLGSQVLQFDKESVALALGDGSQKRYPNDGAFVLIGADPPIAWLEKMGIHFVERPHQYQMGKSDDIVRRYVANPMECPEDAARAAAQILGGSTGVAPARAAAAISLPMPIGEAPARGPKKWLRSATSIFSTRTASQLTPLPAKPSQGGQRGKRLDAPMPLSEFAKRQKSHHQHTGHGRRDQLSAGERTRILRMLRDEGGRLADEDSQVHIGTMPPPPRQFDFDFDDADAAPAPPPAPAGPGQAGRPLAPPLRDDVPAKPALVVGLAQARKKRGTLGPQPPNTSARVKPATAPPPIPGRALPPPIPGVVSGNRPVVAPPRQPASPKRPLPSPFTDKTREVVNNDDLISAVRSAPGPGRSLFDEPTRLGDVDAALLEASRGKESNPEYPPQFLPATTDLAPMSFDDNDEATRLANVDAFVNNRPSAKVDERTRAVDIRQDPSINDIDWDID